MQIESAPLRPAHGTDALFRRYRLNGLDLPNRVVMAPMTRSSAPGGVPTPAMADYYRRRAEHGVGLILTESVGIDRPGSVNEPDIPVLHGDAAIASWQRVVDAVHGAGGRIMPQLWHVGGKRSKVTPEWTPAAGYESPSGLSSAGERVDEPMSDAAIADTIGAYARAAVTAERMGFDGVEVHGAHGYLIDQFFQASLNRRGDRYGGPTLVARSRFALEVLKAVRSAVTAGFPVLLRLSQWAPKDFSARLTPTPQALAEWLEPFIAAGVDAFDISGLHYGAAAFPDIDPLLSLAGWAKKLTGATVMTVGSVGLAADTYQSFAGRVAPVAPLDDVLDRLTRAEFDLVAVGRALLQDPAWLEKVRQGRQRDLQDFTPDAFATLY